ncbi:MAG: hypothetical protein OYL92_10910 [Acidobacteriota bacterium]|nr:hypothetical protein [Acidobacteriota bacterium]
MGASMECFSRFFVRPQVARLAGSVMWLLALSGPAAAADQGAGEYTDCVPSSPQVTFEPGYAVSMCFEYERDGGAEQADAIDFGLGSRQSGLLWFFDPDNAEVLIKVLDGCEMNGHRWVFVAPVTTLAFNLSVEEAATGRRWVHRNPRGGVTAEARSDLTAFPCGPAAASSASLTWPGASYAAPLVEPMADVRHAVAGAAADCAPRPVTTLGGGFTVSMCVEHEKDGEVVVTQARDYGLDSSQSALLYFFERDNAEVLVKVLDGCALNGHRWVFVAPVTTLAFNLSIEPPGGGAAWTHRNSLGRTAAARSDLEAFDCADDEQPGGPDSFTGQVVGYRGAWSDVEAILTAKGVLRVATPDAFGRFRFDNLAAGEYAVKVHAAGHRTTPARLVDIPYGGRTEPFDLTPIPTDPFVFHWEEDQSTAGTEYSAAVNRPHEIEFEGGPVRVVDNSSANVLAHDYNMLLVDSGEASWSQEHAWRLLTTMRSIPQETRDPYGAQSLAASQWLLTPRYLEGDIQVRTDGPSPAVLISEAAFVNANPRVATVDGKRGIWFSKRLHHALVRYVTDNGRDVDAYERIFEERYGVTTEIRDYAALTRWTTGEGAGRFQRFHPWEIVTLLNMLEEFPSGMHKTQGLTHVVRRLDGTPHPLYPGAPAVAWPDAGYIEFMDSAFLSHDVDHIQRLVIHEKAHFLWAHVFDQTTRDDWARLGGWYEDPQSPSGWSTTKTTEFVSAYGHLKNPNEDMAETISYFIIEPDKLRSRSAAKYEFVRDRIMQGNVYLSRIREDLTFQVYNLFPDYVFPGKVRRVDISVTGGGRQDKGFRIEIELHALDRDLEGATHAYTRVNSSIGTYFDLYLYPLDENGRRMEEGTVLVGKKKLSRHSKAGYWLPTQLKIVDKAGNERFQRGDDFGWKLYIDNFLEDWTPPEYVAGTARLGVGREAVEGRVVQSIEASWEVSENNSMRERGACYASVNDEVPTTYRLEEYGDFRPAEKLCKVVFLMPDYMPSSRYSLNYINMVDQGGNWNGARFTEEARDEEPQRIRLSTTNPDIEPPELDLNRMRVDAEPTNPEQPNGETIVTLSFRIRDNISGYTSASIQFLDPQGITHQVWAYDDERGYVFPRSDPSKWKEHTIVYVLPPGSAPGTWGVSDMALYDRAHNFVHHDFTEVIHFTVD